MATEGKQNAEADECQRTHDETRRFGRPWQKMAGREVQKKRKKKPKKKKAKKDKKAWTEDAGDVIAYGQFLDAVLLYFI